MTVITYSNAVGRVPKELQVPEHPSAFRNVPEPLCGIVEPRTTEEPLENRIIETCWIKGPKWFEEKGGRKSDEGPKRGKLQMKRQTWDRGVFRETRKSRGREQLCKLWDKEDGKDLTWVEGQTEQREKRMENHNNWTVFSCKLPLTNSTDEKVRRERKMTTMMRWHHGFLCLSLLILSLCPKPASSQVRANS